LFISVVLEVGNNKSIRENVPEIGDKKRSHGTYCSSY